MGESGQQHQLVLSAVIKHKAWLQQIYDQAAAIQRQMQDLDGMAVATWVLML
jgi:hypothetical protein